MVKGNQVGIITMETPVKGIVAKGIAVKGKSVLGILVMSMLELDSLVTVNLRLSIVVKVMLKGNLA